MQSPPSIERILYVDDDPLLQGLVKLSLGRARGWTVVGCLTGARAVATALETRPQIILLDIVLGDADGIDVLAALRREPELEGIPVVFVSGCVDGAERDRFLSLGAAGAITKPINPMTLPDQVWEIWRQWNDKRPDTAPHDQDRTLMGRAHPEPALVI